MKDLKIYQQMNSINTSKISEHMVAQRMTSCEPHQRPRRAPKLAPTPEFVREFRIRNSAYRDIERTLGKYPAERGGALIGDPGTGEITNFVFDEDADTTSVVYQPNVDFLNRTIDEYEKRGLSILGIAHSHPHGYIKPSGQDLIAGYNNITSPYNGHLRTWHLPIIQARPDTGSFEFHPYIVSCTPTGEPKLHKPVLSIITGQRKWSKNTDQTSITPSVADTPMNLGNPYERVSGNVDFKEMTNTTVILVGAGASGDFAEKLARLGIKKWHIFDPDYVEVKNIPAQNFENSDVGLRKVDALKARLERVEFEAGNPALPQIEIKTGQDFLSVADAELDRLVSSEQAAGQQVIFIFATDFHPAQARGSRVALKYRVPVFWVGMYKGGMAGEIIFWDSLQDGLPCYRCITQSRYDSFDTRPASKKIAAKSAGLPFSTSLVDAILGHLVIGAIHRNHPLNPHARTYQRVLREKRNFIQMQLDPEYRMGGDDIFAEIAGSNIVTFNTLFQSDGKKYDCADCGGKQWKNTNYLMEEIRIDCLKGGRHT